METGQTSEAVRPAGWFKPGVSGNPGGRPRKPPELVLIQKMTRAQAQKAIELLMGKSIRRIERAIGSKDEAIALRASFDVLDRSLGKAMQRVDANINGPDPVTMVTPELLKQAALRLLAAQAVDAKETVDAQD